MPTLKTPRSICSCRFPLLCQYSSHSHSEVNLSKRSHRQLILCAHLCTDIPRRIVMLITVGSMKLLTIYKREAPILFFHI